MEYIYTKHVLFNLKCIFSEVVYFYLLTPETLTTVNVASGWAVWDPRQDLTEECSSMVSSLEPAGGKDLKPGAALIGAVLHLCLII